MAGNFAGTGLRSTEPGRQAGSGSPWPSPILRCAAPIRPTALLDRNCKDIADAAFGLDDTWRLRVCLQFAPQPQYLNIDAAIKDVFVKPGRLQQMLARKRPLRRIEEGQQQGVFAFA